MYFTYILHIKQHYLWFRRLKSNPTEERRNYHTLNLGRMGQKKSGEKIIRTLIFTEKNLPAFWSKLQKDESPTLDWWQSMRLWSSAKWFFVYTSLQWWLKDAYNPIYYKTKSLVTSMNNIHAGLRLFKNPRCPFRVGLIFPGRYGLLLSLLFIDYPEYKR